MTPYGRRTPTPALLRPRLTGWRQRLLCAASAAAVFGAAVQAQAQPPVQPQPRPTPAGHDITALSLEELLDIDVVGASKYGQKQREVAAAVHVVTRQELRSFGWRTLDEVLASLPGLHSTYDRQYKYVGARGFGLPGDFNTRTLITINGNRLNDPAYDSGPLGRQFPLDLDLIERIEYIPGPGGAVYGQNAMFGVINVVTRDGADFGGPELAASAQSPQAALEGRLSWGKTWDQGLDVMLSVSGLNERGTDRLMDFGAAGVSGVATGMDAERAQQFFGRLRWGPWSFEHVVGSRRKADPTGAYFSAPLVAGQYQGDLYAVTQLQFERAASPDWQLSARLFGGQQRYKSRLVYGSGFSFPGTADWYGLELRALSSAWADHKLMFGLEAQSNPRVDQRVLDLSNPGADRLIQSPGYRLGLYAQDEWRINPNLAATLGLRLDRNSATGTHASPRAALIWQLTPASTVKALYGKAHRAPNAYERDYADGFAQVANPGLKAESIQTLEAVLDHRASASLQLRASVYQWTMRDLVTLGLDTASGLPQYQSGPHVMARGLEMSLDKGWPGGARLRASVSLQKARDAAGQRLLNSPQSLVKLNASSALPWLGLRAGYEWQWDSPRKTQNGSLLGSYAVSNLQLSSGAFAQGLDLSLSLHNLLGKRYAHPGADSNWQNALEQDGRSIRIKARYCF